MKLDRERPERIAFATSEPLFGGQDPSAPDAVYEKTMKPARWTELAVYYLHAPKQPGRPWRAVVRGCSTHPGEQLREEVITVGTLERALKLFDTNSQLGRSVIVQAEDWVETARPSAVNLTSNGGEPVIGISGRGHIMTPIDPFHGTTQEEALRWLYGDELDQAKPATLLSRDFGVGESSVRMAIAQGRDIKLPLRAVARFLDRGRFRFERAREKEGSANV